MFLEVVPEVLTADFVKAAVAEIRACAGDDEGAHSMEDTLHSFVLKKIAEGKCLDPATCAEMALRTKDISFERWCA